MQYIYGNGAVGNCRCTYGGSVQRPDDAEREQRASHYVSAKKDKEQEIADQQDSLTGKTIYKETAEGSYQ
jgi:hypothetical protein